MKHEEIRQLLDAYLDGDLSQGEERIVRAHLEQCSACAQEVEALTALLADLKALPSEMPPPRDLWPQLEEVLAEPGSETGRGPVRPLAWLLRPGLLAAAAVVLLMATVLMRVSQEETVAPQTVDVVAVTNLDAAYRGLDLQAAGLRRQVAAGLRQSTTFPPEAATALENDIEAIDSAIAEVKQALTADPSRRDLSQLLTDYYLRKLELLNRMNRLISTDAV